MFGQGEKWEDSEGWMAIALQMVLRMRMASDATE